MSIRQWHWGKLVILWAWGGVIAGPLLFRFLTQPVQADPVVSTVTFFLSLVILLVLSAVTWRWLGDRTDAPRSK